MSDFEIFSVRVAETVLGFTLLELFLIGLILTLLQWVYSLSNSRDEIESKFDRLQSKHDYFKSIYGWVEGTK